MPHRLKTATRAVGAKQTLKAVLKGQAQKVYVALDADEHIIRSITQLCANHGVSITEVPTMAQLGKACSIEVDAAVAAIVQDNI